MRRRLPTDPEPKVLSSPVAERVLTRASELDAALRGGTMAVAELRSAAIEAGISPEAFDAALAEVRESQDASAPNVAERSPARRWRGLAIGLMALIAAGTLGVARMVTPDPAGPSMIDKTFPLRCLSADRAAALIRPVLDLPTNTVVVLPARAGGGELRVRATSTQLEKLQSVLDPYEGVGSAACERTPPAKTQ